MKSCTKCLVSQPTENFYKHSRSKDGLCCHCKTCRKKNVNRDKYLKRKKSYYQKNKIKILKNKKLERELNPEKYKQKSRGYSQQWKSRNRDYIKAYKNRPEQKIRKNIKTRIKRLLSSPQSTSKLLGCSGQFLKNYLEAKFVNGMTWDNYGFYGWHMDHIRPIASFDLNNEDEVKKCFHYTNLQPLWAKDNLSKGAKF